MNCYCNKPASEINNLSTGQIIYKCSNPRYIWDKDLKTGDKFVERKNGFCDFEFIEGEIAIYSHVFETKKKYTKKLISFDRKFDNLCLKVGLFKRKKTYKLYEEIKFMCIDLDIIMFDDWEKEDLGEYCEFLLEICNCKETRENYYNKKKDLRFSELKKINYKIGQILLYFQMSEKHLKENYKYNLNLENLPYCEKILNKKVSKIGKGLINEIILSEDKNKLKNELVRLKKIKFKIKKFISLYERIQS